MPTPEKLARLFHETYEKLAPGFGYSTRSDTMVFQSESPNGRLMVAVCASILGNLGISVAEAIDYSPENKRDD